MREDAAKVLGNIDLMILAIKGKGGYKNRKLFRLSDLEFDKFYLEATNKFRIIAVGIVVAEAMLLERSPSVHPRWDEYLRRRAECMAELGSK